MRITVSRWGNSLGVRIPMAVADALSIRCGDHMSCELNSNSIVLRKEKSTAQLFEEFYQKDYASISAGDLGSAELVDFGEDVGGELF